jgi:hypothetical protein
MTVQDNLFALNYSNLLIKFALQEGVDFKALFLNINNFFAIFDNKQKKIKSLANLVKIDKSINLNEMSQIDRLLFSVLLKKKIYLKDKILYFFINTCNENDYLKFFKITHFAELTNEDKKSIINGYGIDEKRDFIFYKKDIGLLGGWVIENVNKMNDFSRLKYINEMGRHLKLNVQKER